MPDLNAVTIWLPTLLLVAFRVGGIFLTAPVFSASAAPARLKVFMSLVVALAVVARLAAPAAVPTHWLVLAVGLVAELAVGAAIGFTAGVMLAGVELGAVHVAQQMGIGLAEAYNPGAADASGTVRGLLRLTAVVIFLLIGGHRALLSALLGSFDTVPPGGGAGELGMLPTILAVLAASFTLALKVAAPVLVALLLTTAAMGLLQRTVPQCHVLSVGLPVRAVVGLIVLAAAVAAIAGPIQAAWQYALGEINRMLATAG